MKFQQTDQQNFDYKLRLLNGYNHNELLTEQIADSQ